MAGIAQLVQQGTENPPITGSNLLLKINTSNVSEMAGIAQLVEQRTENPRVTSSNLVPDT